MQHKPGSGAEQVNTGVCVPMLSVLKARPAGPLPTHASPHSPGGFSGNEEGALDSAKISPTACPSLGEKAAPEWAAAPPGSGASLCWWSRRSVSSIWARVTLVGAATRGALPPLSLESSSSSRRCVSFLRSSCSRRRFSFSSWGEGVIRSEPHHWHGWTEALLCARPCARHRGQRWAPWDYLRSPRLYDYGNNREPWPRQVGGWLLKEKGHLGWRRSQPGGELEDRRVLSGGNAGAKAMKQEPPRGWCGWSREGKMWKDKRWGGVCIGFQRQQEPGRV